MTGIDGAALRQWRRSRGWDVPEMARRLRRAGDGEPLPTHDSLITMIRRWERAGMNQARARAERYELLYCAALKITPGELRRAPRSSQPAAVPSGAPTASPAISELCSVLADCSFRLDDPTIMPGTPCSAADLERDLGTAYSAYQQARYTASATRVSALLTDTQTALRDCSDADRDRLRKVHALAYQVAASLLSKAGRPETAWIAAERGLAAADASGSPVVRCSLVRSVAFSLLAVGHLESAMRLVESGADSMRHDVTADETGLSVYGTLFLAGSMAAARFGDETRTADYLQEAGRAASRLRGDANHLWTAFGPTNVKIHQVNTAMELGDVQAVLDHGMALDTSALPVERRVRYLLDVACTHTLTGQPDDALGVLLTAERLAPEQARTHYLSRRVITTLMKNSKGKPPAQLGRLAARAGLQAP